MGIELQFAGERHRIDMRKLTGGKAITVYGQTEVVKDLIAARLETGRELVFEAEDVRLEGIDSDRPRVSFSHGGEARELECDVIAGCDGFHGISRPSIPEGVLSSFVRDYPYGWLGILAAVPPSNDELIYAHHERGFALLSLRSPEVSRLYIQCDPDEDIAAVARCADLGGAPAPAGPRRLDARGGACAREGRDGDAQLRHRADAVRESLPCRRRRAHRPSDRGKRA